MEQILTFVLGAGIALFVWGVVVVFKTVKEVKQIEQTITGHQDWILRNDELVNRRIDQEIDRVNNLHKDSISFTDSRVDRLEQKLSSIDNDGCKPVKKKLIKG
jgi:hypothetical protein